MKSIATFTLTVASIVGMTLVAFAQQTNLPQLGKDPIADVIKAMTLEEKVSILVGPGLYVPGNPFPGMPANPTPAQKKVVGAAGAINGIPRLGIPSVIMCDGPAGVHAFNIGTSRIYYATAWPVGTLLASTWDTAVVKKVGAGFGKEAKEYGIDIVLGPGMNIHRNPLGGRNFEYYSEDPVVTGNIAAAMVNGVQSVGVGVSAKHFFANNNETNRMTANIIASERALREIYLKGWEIMVKKSNPWTIMTSYNLVNGPYTSQNPELVSTILRNEWNFKGYVVTDWGGGNNAVEQMKARNNLIMPGSPRQVGAIIDAVKSGQLDEKILDQNVADMLNITLLTASFKNYKYSDSPNLKAGGKLSREAATEGMVLLKNNDNTLPIQPLSSVALFGMNGYDLITGGGGSGEVNKMYVVSLNEGLFNAGFSIHPELHVAYKNYLIEENIKHPKKSMFEEFMNPTPPIEEYKLSDEQIAGAVASSDRAIISIGRFSGEGADRK
ncbi:MAG TPA: glycosyl hydrolase, partial [Cytophagales bacterium]|nr:glycosyl hydrolase [Cytophagales bacterium]